MVLKLACILSFLDILSLGALIPLLHKHLLNIGGTHLINGILGTVVALIHFLSGPVVGSLSDTKGRSYILRLMFIICLISNSSLLFASSLTFFIFSRLLSGISSKTQILIKTLLSDNIPKEQQSAAFGKLSALSASGFIIGPILGGYLYQKTGDFYILSILLSTTSIICIGLISLMPNNVKAKDGAPNFNFKREIVGSFTKLGKVNWKLLWDIFALKFLSELAFSQFYGTFGILLPEVFQLNQIQIGYIMSIYGSLFIFTNLTLTKLNNILPKEQPKKIFIIFITFTLTLFCLFMSSNIYVFVFFLLPLAYTKSLFDTTFLSSLTERVTESERGITMGSYDSAMSLANLTTPLFMGIINQYYGYNVARLIATIPATIATLLSFYLIDKKMLKVNTD